MIALPITLRSASRSKASRQAVERQLGVHARADLALVGQVPDRLGVLAALFGELAAVLAGAHAHDREALDQRHVDRDGRDAAGGEADHQEAAVEGDAAHALVEHVAADRVVDHVRAAPAGELLDPLAETRRSRSPPRPARTPAATTASLASEAEAAITFAPSSLPRSTAARPTPPAAPCTSSHSPGSISARRTSAT